MLKTNLYSDHCIKLKVAWHYSRYLVAYTNKDPDAALLKG
jgi:hypothetical protein